MADSKVPPTRDAGKVATLLDSPEITALIATLEDTRWTGRPGYPIRAMIGMTLAKSLYAVPTWSRMVRLAGEMDGLRRVLGGLVPSQWACYRFTAKLREHPDALRTCVDAVVAALAVERPGYGTIVAIDGSDMPAYANGQRYLYNHGPERERFSDSDAAWGHRSSISTRKGGGYYGFKLHAAVCAVTDLPVAWTVRPANDYEGAEVAGLLDAVTARGARPEYAVMDKGYDASAVHTACMDRGIRPVIPLKRTADVARGEYQPSCEHGAWTFAGADDARRRTKWRCPSGGCSPASRWVKADRLHPLLPRVTPRYRATYAKRGAVEREFGRLKHDWALGPLRVRGLSRVALHADLTILARLVVALSDARPAVAGVATVRAS
jgi:hypothetical protein